MPIRTTCPDCQMAYSLADHLRGKKMRCKKCNRVIVVGRASQGQDESEEQDEAGDEGSGQHENIQRERHRPKSRAAGRRHSQDDEDGENDEDDRKRPRRQQASDKGKKSKMALILALSGGGVLVVAGIAVGIVLLLSGKKGNDGKGGARTELAGMPKPKNPDNLIKAGVLQFPIPEAGGELLGIHFSNTSAHQVVIHSRGGRKNPGKERLDRYNLKTGENLSSTVLPRVLFEASAALSPDGTRLAIATVRGLDSRVSLWSLPDNRETLSEFDLQGSAIKAMTFKPRLGPIALLDNDRLLVVHKNGTRTLWNLSERREVYSVAQPPPADQLRRPSWLDRTLALSPDGKLLAVHRGAGVDLISTENGQSFKRCEDPAAPAGFDNVWAMAFRPDGQELIAFYEIFLEKGNVFKKEPRLQRWDVKTGQAKAAAALPVKFGYHEKLTWWGTDHVLFWNMFRTEALLVNLNKGQYVRHLTLDVRMGLPMTTAGIGAVPSSDSRLWIATKHQPGDEAFLLTAIEAPVDKDYQAPTKKVNPAAGVPEWLLGPDGIENQRRV